MVCFSIRESPTAKKTGNALSDYAIWRNIVLHCILKQDMPTFSRGLLILKPMRLTGKAPAKSGGLSGGTGSRIAGENWNERTADSGRADDQEFVPPKNAPEFAPGFFTPRHDGD